jgi:hypothetical protein
LLHGLRELNIPYVSPKLNNTAMCVI